MQENNVLRTAGLHHRQPHSFHLSHRCHCLCKTCFRKPEPSPQEKQTQVLYSGLSWAPTAPGASYSTGLSMSLSALLRVLGTGRARISQPPHNTKGTTGGLHYMNKLGVICSVIIGNLSYKMKGNASNPATCRHAKAILSSLKKFPMKIVVDSEASDFELIYSEFNFWFVFLKIRIKIWIWTVPKTQLFRWWTFLPMATSFLSTIYRKVSGKKITTNRICVDQETLLWYAQGFCLPPINFTKY